MSEDAPERSPLTNDQIIYLYERQLNRAVLYVFAGGFLAIAVAVTAAWFIQPLWVGMIIGAVLIVAGGMLQRLVVLRVKCPNCGRRVLGRIHSIVQARHVEECPHCEKKLRS